MNQHYAHFTAKDFSTDDVFIEWVLNAQNDVAWKNWLQQYPEKKNDAAEAEVLIRAFQHVHTATDEVQIDHVWNAIQQRLQATQSTKVASLSSRWKQLMRIAAIFLLVTGAALIVASLYRRSQTIAYATVYGETKTIILPDGSSVMLNANSEISFKKGWEKNANRDVELKGEAYFSVQHLKNNQPFVVHVSDEVTIRVLGTEFNVSNRHNNVKVLLNKGSIQLEQTLAGTTNKLRMKPGDLVEENDKKLVQKKNIEAGESHQVLAWKEQKIVFENADVDELKSWLKDTHDIELHIAENTLQNIHFNGEFAADDWKVVIAALETMYGLTASYHENEVVLQSK